MKTLALALVAMSLSAVAMAQNPDDMHLGQPGYGGTGCPAGTVSATLSPDFKSLSILFDQFVVEAGPASAKTLDRKNCDIAIPLHVPQGWSVGFISIDYRGFSAIPRSASGRLGVEYFLAGDGRGISRTKTFYGPSNQDYLLTDDLTVEGNVWSRCGVDVNLRTRASLMLSNRGYEDAMLTLDSMDLTSGLVYQIQWKRCN